MSPRPFPPVHQPVILRGGARSRDGTGATTQSTGCKHKTGRHSTSKGATGRNVACAWGTPALGWVRA